MSFPELTGSGKDRHLHPRVGQERQLEQCSSQASDNRFSMASTSLSIDSVYEEEKVYSETRKARQTTGAGKTPYRHGKIPL